MLILDTPLKAFRAKKLTTFILQFQVYLIYLRTNLILRPMQQKILISILNYNSIGTDRFIGRKISGFLI